MRTESPNTQSHAGDFISDAVRRVFSDLPNDTTTVTPDASPTTERRRPLRRWSVADLLANAVVVPRERTSHC
jgi:hypothetical protein